MFEKQSANINIWMDWGMAEILNYDTACENWTYVKSVTPKSHVDEGDAWDIMNNVPFKFYTYKQKILSWWDADINITA